MRNIDGFWYGAYHYTDARLAGIPLSASANPVAFRAQFIVDRDGKVTGTIADEMGYDFPASLDGEFDGTALRFTKRYFSGTAPTGASARPIVYQGALSEDGTTLSGTWRIRGWFLILPVSTSGIWEAQRYTPAY